MHVSPHPIENAKQHRRSPIAGRLGIGSRVRTFGSSRIHHVLLELRSRVAAGGCVLRDFGHFLSLADLVFRSSGLISEHEVARKLRDREC